MFLILRIAQAIVLVSLIPSILLSFGKVWFDILKPHRQKGEKIDIAQVVAMWFIFGRLIVWVWCAVDLVSAL